MNASLSKAQREIIARLAAEILPGTESQPSAASIDIAGSPLDRVLRLAPETQHLLDHLLGAYSGNPETFLEALSDDAFNALMTVICAAYVMDPEVRKALGYEGQQALTPNRGGFGAEDLVIEMMGEPKRYRPV